MGVSSTAEERTVKERPASRSTVARRGEAEARISFIAVIPGGQHITVGQNHGTAVALGFPCARLRVRSPRIPDIRRRPGAEHRKFRLWWRSTRPRQGWPGEYSRLWLHVVPVP